MCSCIDDHPIDLSGTLPCSTAPLMNGGPWCTIFALSFARSSGNKSDSPSRHTESNCPSWYRSLCRASPGERDLASWGRRCPRCWGREGIDRGRPYAGGQYVVSQNAVCGTWTWIALTQSMFSDPFISVSQRPPSPFLVSSWGTETPPEELEDVETGGVGSAPSEDF